VEGSVQREMALESAKEALEGRVHAAEAQLGVAKDKRTHFEDAMLARLDKESAADKSEIASLKETVKTIQAERNKISSLLERERMNAALHSAKTDSLEKDVRQATQTSLERKTVLDAATRDLNDVRSQVSAYQKDIFHLREKIEAKDAQLDSLRDAVETRKEDIVEKDKMICQLEFIIAMTTSPPGKSRQEEFTLKLQRREKEILRLRELLAALIQDNDDFVVRSNEVLAPEQQKKYNAMKNIVRAERMRRIGLERELAKILARDSAVAQPGPSNGPEGGLSTFNTPASGMGGLDTPVSLKDTPTTMREFSMVEDTPLKGKGVLVE